MTKFGIRMTMPESDPMRAPHLLGADWESFKWYTSEKARDVAFAQIRREHMYSRPGDVPSVIPEKVERTQ